MNSVQTTQLRDAVGTFSTAYGASLCSDVEANSVLLLHWVQHLRTYHLTGVADQLITAVGCSIREVAGALSLGLLRPALFALRGQVDLLLAWLYFKDHSVEWDHVNLTADGFKLKKELLQYIEAHCQRFGTRFGVLKDNATRSEVDPYRLLSAHIHAQSEPVLPGVINLKDMVRSESSCRDGVRAVHEVAEYLNDILLAIYVSEWHSLPKPIKD
jgi:hypothetical protein